MLDIKINDFEGPLDLLLHLIENKKMDILQINISELIDEYLKIINEYKEDKFKLKVEFLQMASTLLEIKAYSILKKEIKNQKEMDLEERLIEYKLFKELSQRLSDSENEYYFSYKKKREEEYVREIVEHDNSELNLENILKTIDKMVRDYELRNKDNLKIDFTENFSVEDARIDILNLPTNTKTVFSSLLKGKFSRDRIVSFFLAVLELYKASEIDILIEDDNFFIIKEEHV